MVIEGRTAIRNEENGNPNSNSVGRVSRTLDGFGRVESETGTYTSSSGAIALTSTVSTVESLYAPCGCSPLGKLWKTSRPYAPGGTVYWTEYGYDGIGRTNTVKAPDGSSTTYYTYAGALVGVTDPAGKWKTFSTDAVGNLTQVNEPSPAGGADFITNYAYDTFNRLITVTMPRGGTTQTRSFNYSVAGQLMSATNPENGTVTNIYNPDTTLAYKIDAKSQKVAYSYDSYKRVTQVAKYPNGVNEDVCQRVNYYYDSNPDTTNYLYTSYLAGRLASVHYAGAGCASGGNNYVEMYAYSQAGQATRKTFRLKKGSASGDLEAVYTYDQEGKMVSQQYPLGATYNYGYDSMGRTTSMTDAGNSVNLVSSVTYGPAGEVLLMSGASVGETRTYNANGQLTRLQGLGGMDLTYDYAAAGLNNGQIASQYDAASGETITYAYDSLKRLASASSMQGWGQGFTYDGFGNLTQKTALSGNPPVGSYPADPATNRLSGGGYDANGNQTSGGNSMTLAYDVANRMASSVGSSQQGFFEYDASNKRVYQLRQHYTGSAWATDATEYYFYGPGGKKLGTYIASASGARLTWNLSSTQVFFRGRIISRSSVGIQEDVRASIGRYFPYGEDRESAANDSMKFATYTRDSSGLDYAEQRYYAVGSGRFTSSDPYRADHGASAASFPGSWNRYGLVLGDPINLFDPFGLDSYNLTCFYVDGSLDSCQVFVVSDSGRMINWSPLDDIRHEAQERAIAAKAQHYWCQANGPPSAPAGFDVQSALQNALKVIDDEIATVWNTQVTASGDGSNPALNTLAIVTAWFVQQVKENGQFDIKNYADVKSQGDHQDFGNCSLAIWPNTSLVAPTSRRPERECISGTATGQQGVSTAREFPVCPQTSETIPGIQCRS